MAYEHLLLYREPAAGFCIEWERFQGCRGEMTGLCGVRLNCPCVRLLSFLKYNICSVHGGAIIIIIKY